ncbi:hypothetical protein DPMN_169717 [Dreissena polymorpha]|uniref:Uncharacterized protein n=1 Tax=Dreissena polymorpha TaxID=45954 RepID=A0A9D4DV46_DREPO|nr:hypothetical protein DPMN_169717 [Dreissena polymorpha]
MASKGIRPFPEFNPSESASSWEDYKRDFQIHLDALGLDEKPGRRKVDVLLANMGRECVKFYYYLRSYGCRQLLPTRMLESRQCQPRINTI